MDSTIREGIRRQNRALAELSSEGLWKGADRRAGFRAIVEKAAQTLQVGRAGIWLFDADQTEIACDDLYIASEDRHVGGFRRLDADYPKYFRALSTERAIAADDARADPHTQEFLDGYLIPNGIGAILDAPVMVRGRSVGVVCLEHLGGARKWRDDEISFAGSMADFTALVIESEQRRQAERALDEQQALHRQALSAARMGTWRWDVVGGRLQWSEEVGPLFDQPAGYTPAGFDEYARLVHAEDLANVKTSIARALEDPRFQYQVEHRVLFRDGSVRWVEGRGTVSRTEDGQPRDMTGTVTDVTGRKRLEDELRQAQKMEAIGQLAGGVAHDFNNLLTVIAGEAELAKLSLCDQCSSTGLDTIIEASSRAASLTRQLLTFARKQPIRPTVVDTWTLVSTLARMLRRLIGEHIELDLRPPEEQCTVRADPAQLEQVIVNLVVNARDAMPEGGRLTIEMRTREVSRILSPTTEPLEPGRYVQVIVQDTGVGIPPEVVGRIFDPFFSTKEMGRGTGLGLSTCYGIVSQAGGRILVDSARGRGTRFDVLLPWVQAPSHSISRSGTVPRSGARDAATILVVEDAPMVRDLVTRFLESAGYALLVASDGPEALEAAQHVEGPIDLFLLDVVLPGLRGEPLVARLRRYHPDARVLFVSGYAEGTIAEHGVISEGVRLLAKPFRRAELLEQVAQALRDPAPATEAGVGAAQ